MVFDFEKFSNITQAVFPNVPYSLSEALEVFRYYFQKYEEHTGHPHPPIKASQIVSIVQDMPWLCAEDKGTVYSDVTVYAYYAMIDQHFATKYKRCDYNINHFFSGRIRELRFYETCY